MNLVLFFLLILSVIISFKYFALKRQINHMSLQIDQVTCGKTEKMLDLSLADQDLELLAAKINRFFDCQRKSAAKALQHEEELKNSIANISHDLRTPLTVINGHLQILQKSRLLPDQKDRIETALRKTCRLRELIDVFYDLSILEADQTEPDWEDLNFSNLLIDFLADSAPLFQSRQLSPNHNARILRLCKGRPQHAGTYSPKSAVQCSPLYVRENLYLSFSGHEPQYSFSNIKYGI